MSTLSPYRVNSYRRLCDVCGRPRQIESIRFADGVAICDIHPQYRTAQQLNKINSRLKVPRLIPVPQPKAFAPVDTLTAAEAQIFNFIIKTAPYESADITNGAGGTPYGIAMDAAQTAPPLVAPAEAALYLYSIIAENRRPARWISAAKTKLGALADHLMLYQNGFGLHPTVKINDLFFGSFDALATNDHTFFTDDTALGGLALLRAYQVLGDQKYLLAAQAAASFLRTLQCGHLCSLSPSSSDAAGASPYASGFFTFAAKEDGSNVVRFDHSYYPSSIVGIEFLSALMAVSGDGLYGSTGSSGIAYTLTFTAVPQALLSTMIADARAFWANGIFDVVAGAKITGLSATTPREFFNSYPTNHGNTLPVGTGSWQFQDGSAATGALITASNWAKGLRSLYAVEGLSATVLAIFDYLQSFASNSAFELPAECNGRLIQSGAKGEYDPSMAPATLLKVRTGSPLAATAINGSSFYDWAAAGMLAPIAATRDRAGLTVARDELSLPRQRFAEGNQRDGETLYLGPLGISGLSFQPWTSATARIQSVTRAAQVGNFYRQSPKAFTGQGH